MCTKIHKILSLRLILKASYTALLQRVSTVEYWFIQLGLMKLERSLMGSTILIMNYF